MTLREFRKSRGMTQRQLADLIGCGVSAVSRYEQDRIPEDPIMLRIVKVTGGAVTPNDFYGVAREVAAQPPAADADSPPAPDAAEAATDTSDRPAKVA